RVGVVGDDHVSLREPARAELLQRRCNCEGERPEKAGDAVALRDQLAARIRQPGCEIEHLVDDRALRGALEGDEHLVADRDQRVLDDLDGERVDARDGSDRHRYPSVSMIRLPYPSTRSRWPGKTTVDAAGSSTTAGPSSSDPAPSSERS